MRYEDEYEEYEDEYEEDRYRKPVNRKQNKPKGKGAAIAAFVLALVAFLWFASAAVSKVEYELLINLLGLKNYSQYGDIIMKVATIFQGVAAMIVALISEILAICGYVGHGKNVRNGVVSKPVIAFSVIATLISTVALIGSIVMLIV